MNNPYSTPEGQLEADLVFCRDCGAKISKTATACPSCGATQSVGGRSKVAAALLALFLGAFGFHRFYLGQWWGIFYLLFFWTYIPSLVSLVETFVFLFTSDQKWNEKYGDKSGSSVLVLALAGFFVIIPIVGILAAIAIPAYQGYVDQAEQAQQVQIQQDK